MKLRSWQRTAKKKVIEVHKRTGKCRVIGPPGIGKTALAAALAKAYGRALIVSVRTRILSQYVATFRELDPKRPLLVIASHNPHVRSIPPSNIDDILGWIKQHKNNSKATILCMYQSSGAIVEILKEAEDFLPRRGKWFDLSVLDEGHCSTGVATLSPRHWKHIHAVNDRYARKVVSVTATERHIDDELEVPEGHTIFTQSAEDQYGPVAYEMSFVKAVRLGYLADYKIVGMFSSDKLTDSIMKKLGGSLIAKLPGFLKEAAKNMPSVRQAWASFSRQVTPDEIFKAWCVLECLKKEKKKRCLLFFNRVNEAIRFNLILLIVSRFKGAPLRLDQDQVLALHAETSFDDERKIYRAFESKKNKPVLISSVDKLTMGVDFPSADMAGFIDVRKGEIRLPQSAGRITRKDGDKKSIILILGYLDNEGYLIKFDGSYARSKQHACRSMLDILYQLQKIDSRMIKVVTALEHHPFGAKSITIGGGALPEVQLDLPPDLTRSLRGVTIKEATGEKVSFDARMADIYAAARKAARDLGLYV